MTEDAKSDGNMQKYERALTYLVPVFSQALDEVVEKGIAFPEPLPREVGVAVIAHAIVACGAMFAQDQGTTLPVLKFMLDQVFISAQQIQRAMAEEEAAEAAAKKEAERKPLVTLT